MKGLDIPTPVIILCFIFGAWPIGVVLAVLKAVNSDYKKQQRSQQQWQSWQSKQNSQNNWSAAENNGQGTVDGQNGTQAGRTTNYKTSEGPEGPNGTTYHYSYVKNKATAQSTDTTESTKNTVDTQNTANRGTSQQKTAAPNVGAYSGYGRPQGYWNRQTQVPNPSQIRARKGHKRSAATVLSTVFMGISLTVSLILFLAAVSSIPALGLAGAKGSVLAAMISSSITAVLYLFRQFYKSRDYRIISYLSALHGERFYSISKLADMADVSTGRVIKDLHYMQAKGLLPDEAVIDRGLGYLILFKSARAEAEADSLKGKQAPEEKVKPKTKEEIKIEMSEHEKILSRIRELNDDIDDVTVSEKIDKIESLTRKIFRLVEEKPEMEGQLDMFLSYYLPTTLKLLNSYAYFEDQGVRGENIDAGMRNIEETLDMLIDGYKTQLDKLFESDTLDVTTDINVLEQMMKADGFTQNSDFSVGDEFGIGTATATAPEEEKKEE